MSDKIVPVYDLKSFIEKFSEGYTTHEYDSVAIIFSESGEGVICDHEAVGATFDSLEDSFTIPLCPPSLEEVSDNGDKKVVFYSMATASTTLSISEILEKCDYREVPVNEFFDRRNYNDRCEQNFYNLVNTLKEKGIDITSTEPSLDSEAKDMEQAAESQSKGQSEREVGKDR